MRELTAAVQTQLTLRQVCDPVLVMQARQRPFYEAVLRECGSPVANGGAILEASHHCNAENHEGPIDSWDVDLACNLLRGVLDVQPWEAPQIDGLPDN